MPHYVVHVRSTFYLLSTITTTIPSTYERAGHGLKSKENGEEDNDYDDGDDDPLTVQPALTGKKRV